MLTTKMHEQATGRIKLNNITLKTGQDLLYYLYNGQLPKDASLMELLPVADQFELTALKATCAKGLATNVNEENYAEMLQLAKLFNIKPLKENVIKYIASNADRLAK
jgi:BTB/POZ domain